MILVKYNTYWFWTDEKNRVLSPYFDSEKEAQEWYYVTWDNWKAIK